MKYLYTLADHEEDKVYRLHMSEECARFFFWLQEHDFIYNTNSVSLHIDKEDEIIDFD